MPVRNVWMPVAVVLAAAAMLGPAGRAGAAAPAGKGWPMRQEGGYLVVETTHYTVRTDHSAEIAQAIASQQEVLFGQLYQRMGGVKPGVAVPRLELRVLKTEEKYLEVAGKDAKNTQGQHSEARSWLVAWGPPDNLDQLFETFRHEGTHQFVAQFIGAQTPIWLNEGLAEFFKNAQFRDGKLVIGQAPVMVVNSLKRAVAEKKLIPVDKMLTMKVDDWNLAVKMEKPEAFIQYEEAWAMVHFLEGGDGGKYRTPFCQYMYHLSRGSNSQQAWEKAFGAGTAAFEKRFIEYLKDLKPTGGMGCRMNMQVLAYLLLNMRRDERCDKDITTFRNAALEGKLGEWTFTGTDGTKITTADHEFLKSMFRCEQDSSKGDEPSYELAPGKEDEPAIIRCRHHLGYVLETRYVKEAKTGKLKPEIVALPAVQSKSAPGAGAGPAAAPAPAGAKKQ